MSELCPCGSGRPLDECCGPYLEGKAWPDDADTMVRSRFSAYCLGKFDYLVETTHPAYREDLTAQMLEEQTRDVHWLRLDMGPCEKDQPEGENGELNFVLNVRAIPPVPCVSARMRTAPCGAGAWPPSRRTAVRNGMARMRRAVPCASSAGSA